MKSSIEKLKLFPRSSSLGCYTDTLLWCVGVGVEWGAGSTLKVRPTTPTTSPTPTKGFCLWTKVYEPSAVC